LIDQERERELLRERVLGWGLACEEVMPGIDLGRDISLVEGPSGLDFARVSGMDNLAQSLKIALTTCLGSDIFNTDYGFDGLNALAEESNAILVRERVRISIIQLLRKDPRVRSIVDVKLGDGRLEPSVTRDRALDVRVVFEVVSGDQLTVDLGRVIPNA
jgi:phage baseplate assembly protein W